MATSSHEVADLSTCPICLEILSKPKYLPCLHTFCEKCIGTYFSSGFEQGKSESFECPVCRSKVSIPSTSISADEWATTLPDNFLIVSLIDSARLKNNEKCTSCERVEEISDASYACVDCSDTLCKTCFKCHKANKLTADHEVIALEDYRNKDSETPLKFKNNCYKHKEEKIKLFCSDHDEPCCSVCVSVNHRKCEKVTTIEDAAKGFHDSECVKTLQIFYPLLIRDVNKVVSETTDALTGLDSQRDNADLKIENVKQSLIQKVNKMGTRLKADLEKHFNTEKDSLEQRKTIFENLKKQIENEKRLLDSCIEKMSDPQIMIEAKMMEKRVNRHKEYFRDKKIFESVKLDMEASSEISVNDLFQDIDTSHKIQVVSTEANFSLEHTDSVRYKLLQKLTFEKAHHEACLTVDKKIIVSFYEGECLEIFDFEGKKVDTLKLAFYPYDIAIANDNEIAIFCSKESKVYILNVTKNTVTKIIQVKPNGKNIHINTTGTLCVCTSDKIYLYENYNNTNQEPSFIGKGIPDDTYCYVDYKGLVYYIDGDYIVVFNTSAEKEIFRFNHIDLKKPSCISGDKFGNIYVTGKNSNNIFRVSNNGLDSDVILSASDGIKEPRYIDVSADGKYVLLTQHSSKEVLLFCKPQTFVKTLIFQ